MIGVLGSKGPLIGEGAWALSVKLSQTGLSSAGMLPNEDENEEKAEVPFASLATRTTPGISPASHAF